MYVSVKYYREDVNAYVGHSYTYHTNLNLNPGDIVSAPTALDPNGVKAIVILANEDEPNFNCKTIEKLWEE